MTDDRPERVAKRIARAGLCSRREAERWISLGRVAVDGRVLDSPAVTVTAGNVVSVDGRPIPEAAATRLWRFHKPAGCLTTTRDPQGRPTIFDLLPKDLPRVVTVGRLDFNSEGLLLLTNDGELARRLEHPTTGWRRRYRVRVYGAPEVEALAALAQGVTVEGVRYGPIEARLDSTRSSNAWLSMALSEGKNREVRRVCEHLGLPVMRLIRVSYGPFQLGNLESGAVDEVPRKVLADQLGAGGGGGKAGRVGGGWAKAGSGRKKGTGRSQGIGKAAAARPGGSKAGGSKAGGSKAGGRNSAATDSGATDSGVSRARARKPSGGRGTGRDGRKGSRGGADRRR